MNDQEKRLNDREESNDPVWDLLARDAAAHPILPSPWFATRVSAHVLAEDRTAPSRQWIRWFLPVPIAAAFLAAVGLWQFERQASEERFEQHMEYLASSSYDYEV